MVDVSKLTLVQRQQHAIMLLHHYDKLCNTDKPSSMFVSPPPIPNIESFYQLTISFLGSGSLGRNIHEVNIQQHTTLEVADTETVIADNEELDTLPM